ncbi:AAA family ATPase [Phenylobacterium sp.]|uniref:nucleotide-binding protein n=1 Tax=Phenylobacterium sp. TaxID=1871053 RepID=UPI0035B4C0E7
MRTIAVIARKGGSGKTTLATHLALAAHLRGRQAMLADADPQRSSTEVLRLRQIPGPQVVETAGPKLFALKVAALRDGVETLVIDTPAGPETEVCHAIVLAELSLVVVRPTYLDLVMAVRTVEILHRLGRPGLIVLNQAPFSRAGAEPPPVRKALDALKLLHTPIAPVIIRARMAYQEALSMGLSVEELTPPGPAAQEIDQLWSAVEDRMAGRL